MEDLLRIVQALRRTIEALRGGGLCEVKVRSMNSTEQGYEVEGTYTLTGYMLFQGREKLEEGEFKALLDGKYNVLSIKISPAREQKRRGPVL